MRMNEIHTDYLVVGAGATAMSFVDTVLSESEDAQIVIVDRHHRPGGHWNEAYSFVRLHQPSAYYGVSSRELGSWDTDKTGLNRGLHGLASGTEVLSHFEQVLHDRFLPSGRVLWRPMSEYRADPSGAHRVTSLLSGETTRIVVRKKLVDGTLAQTAVPATHPPKYEIAAGVRWVTPNQLPEIRRPHPVYTVVGSGKTGVDSCIWLIQNGVPPERIRWIMPRDAWMLNRANFQPGVENFDQTMDSMMAQFDAVAEARTVTELFARLERRHLLLRFDPAVEPTTYRCAIVAPAELALMRTIKDVVRLGHVRAIETDRIVLDKGELPADPDTLYVDCTASAIVAPPPNLPVFDGARINLLAVRICQPLFSAALIAFVESHFKDPAEMNALCAVVPSPERPIDWLRMWSATLANHARWRQNEAVSAWLMRCRLNNTVALLRGMKPDDAARMTRLKESLARADAAAANLPALLTSAASSLEKTRLPISG